MVSKNFTRTIHKVRCKNPSNKTMYFDVVVLDAVSVKGPNGNETLYDMKAEDAVPFIDDLTGDFGSVEPASPTRKSVIKRLTNPNDSTQFFDAEILTAVAYKGPNGKETLLRMPIDGINAYVVDSTNNGLGTDPSKNSTRKLNVVEIDQIIGNPNLGSVNSQMPGYPLAPGGGTLSSNKLLVEQTWAIATKGPNGKEILVLTPLHEGSFGDNINDTTNYGPDPDNGMAIGPPDNHDPNPYVVWPQGGEGVSGPNGPWLGKHMPVSQGPLWYIEAANVGVPTRPEGQAFYDVTVTITVATQFAFGYGPVAGGYPLLLILSDNTGPNPQTSQSSVLVPDPGQDDNLIFMSFTISLSHTQNPNPTLTIWSQLVNDHAFGDLFPQDSFGTNSEIGAWAHVEVSEEQSPSLSAFSPIDPASGTAGERVSETAWAAQTPCTPPGSLWGGPLTIIPTDTGTVNYYQYTTLGIFAAFGSKPGSSSSAGISLTGDGWAIPISGWSKTLGKK